MSYVDGVNERCTAGTSSNMSGRCGKSLNKTFEIDNESDRRFRRGFGRLVFNLFSDLRVKGMRRDWAEASHNMGIAHVPVAKHSVLTSKGH